MMDHSANHYLNGSRIPIFSSADAISDIPLPKQYDYHVTDTVNEGKKTAISYKISAKRALVQRFRRLYKPTLNTLFDIEEGQIIYDKLINAPKDGLYEIWSSFTSESRVCLFKFSIQKHKLYTTLEGKDELNQITQKIIEYHHFPSVIAKLFFEIIYDKGYFKSINYRLKNIGWTGLSMDEKIALLCDLAQLYPNLVKDPNKLYDIAIESPDYLEPIVVKEINRMAIISENADKAFDQFKKHGWGSLSMDEKVVLANQLCKKHRGVTEDLDQVLYNLRVYKDIPNAVMAEKYNLSLDGYLKEGKMSSFVKTIIDLCMDQTGRIIGIKKVWGVEEIRVRAVLQKYKISLC